MSVVIVTGSAGLIGSESVRAFHAAGHEVVGIDNDMRARFFGDEVSTAAKRAELEGQLPRYTHAALDIRDVDAIDSLFRKYGSNIAAVIHAAAQPSHEWAAKEPLTDFGVNALGTLHLLESCRLHAPAAAFVFTSTNKVYGDTPNQLPLQATATRWEIDADHAYADGIDETMSIDQSQHSVFGASKVAADVMVQEYGRYFGMNTVVFRCGCLTGPAHAGAELHGFLSYLMRCTVEGRHYRVFGHAGKQVRDNIHSADLVRAFQEFVAAPRQGEVYNIGGSRHSHCSMLEAIALCEEISARQLDREYVAESRLGDHIWWVSDVRKFQRDYPNWRYRFDLRAILEQIHAACIGERSAPTALAVPVRAAAS